LVTANDHHPVRFAQAHALGAVGFIVKNATRETLLGTMRAGTAGEPLWTRTEMRRVIGVSGTPRLDVQSDAPLTPREGEVLRDVCEGLTNLEIAQRLGISYETVKEHVQHILRKIGVGDRTQAAI
jgi:DNA-binding NarL/FixJ family response regulator